MRNSLCILKIYIFKETKTWSIWCAVFITLAIMGVILLPITVLTFALLRPCMPPIFTSVIYLECKSWEDDGNIGLVFRICGAILTFHLGVSLVSTFVFACDIVLIYPTVVELIILDGMQG